MGCFAQSLIILVRGMKSLLCKAITTVEALVRVGSMVIPPTQLCRKSSSDESLHDPRCEAFALVIFSLRKCTSSVLLFSKFGHRGNKQERVNLPGQEQHSPP